MRPLSAPPRNYHVQLSSLGPLFVSFPLFAQQPLRQGRLTGSLSFKPVGQKPPWTPDTPIFPDQQPASEQVRGNIQIVKPMLIFSRHVLFQANHSFAADTLNFGFQVRTEVQCQKVLKN